MRPKLATAGVAFIVLGLATGFGWWWPERAEVTANLRAQVREVRIDNNSGDVDVRVDDTTSTRVRQVFHYNWSKPGDAYSMDGNTLVLGGCGGSCSVDYHIVVPRGTKVTGEASSGEIALAGVAAVDVRVSSGGIAVHDVRGPVRAEASSGDIDLSRVTGESTLRANSGNITGDGMDGRVSAETSSGDIEMSLTSQRDVRAKASSGDISLRVPDGTYQVNAHASSGGEQVNVPTDPAAAHSLVLSASSGDIDVRRS
jgi:Putative adhesin